MPAGLVCAILTALICLTGDRLLAVLDADECCALIDNLTHGLVGVFTWLSVVVNLPKGRFIVFGTCTDVFLCGVVASAIDLDHFVAARSFSLKKATSLEKRPLMHCTSLWVFICSACFIISKVLKNDRWSVVSWLLIASSISHHIRDGTRRGLWLWPFGSTPPIPYKIYIGLIFILPYLIKYSMSKTMNAINHNSSFQI